MAMILVQKLIVESLTLTARWIFPVAGPPLKNGTITVRGEHIGAVEPHGMRNADVALGNVAVLPGLVNAHTHLDLSGLKGRLQPSQDFIQWIRAVVQHRRSLTPEQLASDTLRGISECLKYGTTLIGDIAGQGLSWPFLAKAHLRAVVFLELLGLPKHRADQATRDAREWLNEHPATPTCRPGLSPHAPYSVRASLFEAACQLAEADQIPLATHLGETPSELELLLHRCGPFVDFLSDLGAWDPEGLVRTTDEVIDHGRSVSLLVVHGNYLKPNQLVHPNRKITVVYCPRTHAAFGHKPHPFREVLAAGGCVALGTDSLASNPDLSMLEEARLVRHSFPDFPGDQLLRMITLSGAEALGWDQETGSLVPGKSADLVLLPLLPNDEPDPHNLLFESDSCISKVMWRGSWIAEQEPTSASA
jgi:cytosine/adenosine deaminase-related metal-dependent hydrolase